MGIQALSAGHVRGSAIPGWMFRGYEPRGGRRGPCTTYRSVAPRQTPALAPGSVDAAWGLGGWFVIGYSGNLGKRMKRANKIGAAAAVILGDDELARNGVTLRDLDSGEQEAVPLTGLEERLARFR